MDNNTRPVFDRAVEDIGNAVWMEHTNVTVPDQTLSTLFYLSALGFTRDPYLMPGLENMWINIGRTQIHTPAKAAQVLRGHTGIVQPDRAALLKRLEHYAPKLAGTKFAYKDCGEYVEATCPWGNKYRMYEPDPAQHGTTQLGIVYVEFICPTGVAEGIARFYNQGIKAPATVVNEPAGKAAKVLVGHHQHLIFRETSGAVPEYDGHHLEIYIADFSGPHKWLKERGLVCEESDQYQYRFKDIIDPDNGKHLYTIEHEVRSMTHPLYARPLVNRNPVQTNRNYRPGYDAGQWAAPHTM